MSLPAGNQKKRSKWIVYLLAAACLCLAFPAAAAASDPGLVLYYEFDEANGNVIQDLSGNSNHGTLAGVELADGKFGKAVDFSNGMGNVVLPKNIMPGNEFSLSSWIYWNGGPNGQRIFDFGLMEGTHIFMSPKGAGDIIRVTSREGSVIDVVLGEGSLPENEWVHMAVVANADVIKVYVNGELNSSLESPKNTMSNVKGEVNVLGKGTAGQFLNGKLDRLAVYSRVLSESEVKALAAGDAPVASSQEPAASEAPAETPAAPVTPSAMPQTGFGGASQQAEASYMPWVWALVVAMAAGSIVLVARLRRHS